MAQSAQQIVTLACQIAKVPGMTSQAGSLLNVILSDLCETYDLAVARRTVFGNFDMTLVAQLGDSIYGSGPYPLPADYLRAAEGDSVWWTLPGTGVKYPLIPIDLSEFDVAVQQAGLQNYPTFFCTDMSPNDSVQQGGTGDPAFYIYMPPSGNYPYTIRYYSKMPDIGTPETSTTVPWFPNQTYLITRLAGELMKIADDARYQSFLGDGPEGAQGILSRYLKLKDDKSNRAITVKLDRRRFGSSLGNLPNTKKVGW